MRFKLHSDFKPFGDQPQAIEKLTAGLLNQKKAQVLLGITGSGRPLQWQTSSKECKNRLSFWHTTKPLLPSFTQEFKSFFPKMQSSILSLITITTSLKPTFPVPTPTLKKDLAINDEIDKNAPLSYPLASREK